MKKQIILASIAFSSLLLGATACNKTDNPEPDEQELITTAKLTFTAGGTSQTFTYKVTNGFGSGTPGTVSIDTIRLAPNTDYAVSAQILNESATPVEDITTEILEKQLEHLFLYASTPASGAGSLTFSNGNKDSAGNQFNLTGTMRSGAAGSSSLDMYLMHAPTNKNAGTPTASGGETDVHAIFPVRLQ